MQKRRMKQSNIFLQFAGLLLLLVLITAALMPGLYARYQTHASGNDGARVAAWAFDLRAEQTIDWEISGIHVPGDEGTYEFSVSNKKGSVVSEVEQGYTITLEQMGTLPLTYTLYEVQDDGTEKQIETMAAPMLQMQIEGTFYAGAEKTVKYKLKVEWPEHDSEDYYADDGFATVYLTVRSEQIN